MTSDKTLDLWHKRFDDAERAISTAKDRKNAAIRAAVADGVPKTAIAELLGINNRASIYRAIRDGSNDGETPQVTVDDGQASMWEIDALDLVFVARAAIAEAEQYGDQHSSALNRMYWLLKLEEIGVSDDLWRSLVNTVYSGLGFDRTFSVVSGTDIKLPLAPGVVAAAAILDIDISELQGEIEDKPPTSRGYYRLKAAYSKLVHTASGLGLVMSWSGFAAPRPTRFR